MNIVIDDTAPYSLVCSHCAHLTSSLSRTCAAFPNGIPKII